jgi:hypothetical protein
MCLDEPSLWSSATSGKTGPLGALVPLAERQISSSAALDVHDTYAIRTRYVQYPYTIRTPCVHYPYAIRTRSVRHTYTIATPEYLACITGLPPSAGSADHLSISAMPEIGAPDRQYWPNRHCEEAQAAYSDLGSVHKGEAEIVNNF